MQLKERLRKANPPEAGRGFRSSCSPLRFWPISPSWAVLRHGPLGTEGPSIGRRLPYLRLEGLTGDSKGVSLDDLTGRVTVVNYWGTWCPPCIREFPQIVELAARFGKHADFRLYAVSCGDSGSDAELIKLGQETRQFLKSNMFDLPTYADQNAASRRAMTMALDLDGGGLAYPTTIILDRNATVRGMWQGFDPAPREMAELIETLLAASPAEP